MIKLFLFLIHITIILAVNPIQEKENIKIPNIYETFNKNINNINKPSQTYEFFKKMKNKNARKLTENQVLSCHDFSNCIGSISCILTTILVFLF